MLKELYLPGNGLKKIHPAILDIPSLTALYLNNNAIWLVPAEIGRLINLRVLDLGYNDIQQVPNEICIPTLKELSLAHNDLNSVPITISLLTSVVVLDLGFNPNLKFLPEEIVQLTTLVNLHLVGCGFRKLPNFAMPKNAELSWISVANNPLADIPFDTLKYVDGRGSGTFSQKDKKEKDLFDKPTKRRVTAYVSELTGMRPSMEDTFVIETNVKGLRSSHLFAIFDGHASHTAAHYLAKYTVEELSKHPLHHLKANEIPSTLSALFCSLTNGIFDYGITSGATAVVTYIHKSDIFFAHSGDARALIVTAKGEVKFYTRDHKAMNRDERLRIQRLGGYITENGRVCGNVAVARSIGDKTYQPFVSSEPELSTFSLKPFGEETLFLVLCCDGVWDVLSNEEVATIVRNSYTKYGKADKIACIIRDTAYMLGSTDNISAMVVEISANKARGEKSSSSS